MSPFRQAQQSLRERLTGWDWGSRSCRLGLGGRDEVYDERGLEAGTKGGSSRAGVDTVIGQDGGAVQSSGHPTSPCWRPSPPSLAPGLP